MNATVYANQDLTRAQVDAETGVAVLEFGANWCSICQKARGLIDQALAGHDIKHIRIEDGSGRPLGRSFGVRLWPTLIFLRDGKEVTRVVRPESAHAIATALRLVAGET